MEAQIKGTVTVSQEEQEFAISLMKEIAYDNGFFNRWEPENYKAKWINKIGPVAKVFFDANPAGLTNDDISEICCGEEFEIIVKYGSLSGFNNLHDLLNDFFNNN